ncbi:hypothetical protein MAPG_05366 [Magnaporthiopsis poae ATCC 64411]|uniref:Uncharacterized protein n=1 Tax=Magnaporthiopsis poae (strain ATCC 64411 / 73-15) TaxID=644358 RepID=A0A0C4DZ74_MAGP6|nr:hypothetical protein MAPG_05366 [Magnaporthiopsis poae ATCC 64411]
MPQFRSTIHQSQISNAYRYYENQETDNRKTPEASLCRSLEAAKRGRLSLGIYVLGESSRIHLSSSQSLSGYMVVPMCVFGSKDAFQQPSLPIYDGSGMTLNSGDKKDIRHGPARGVPVGQRSYSPRGRLWQRYHRHGTNPQALTDANKALNGQVTPGSFAVRPAVDGTFFRQLPALELAMGHFFKPGLAVVSHCTDESSPVPVSRPTTTARRRRTQPRAQGSRYPCATAASHATKVTSQRLSAAQVTWCGT